MERLFVCAWLSVPEARRPDTGGLTLLAVDVMLEDDETIARLNADHMNHRGPTDVLSFPLCAFDPEREAFLVGEIVVGIQVAEREAQARGLSVENELARYAVHGFLHLIGYEDESPKKARAMETMQELVLKTYFG